MIKIIVGLGNPGSQYHQTRHNAGFEFVDQLAAQCGEQFKEDKKLNALVCKVQINYQPVWLLKPQTFMNKSGFSVAGLANFYKIEPEEILVAHDELDIEPGIAKLKQGGGHGGHNGLRDIIACLANNKNFHRLRIGIGHPGQANKVASFVLKKAPTDDYVATERAIEAALKVQNHIVKAQMQPAMNELHSFDANAGAK